MSLSCTISEIFPLVTTNGVEKYFRSNAAVEVAVQAMVVISSVGDMFCIFETLALERCPIYEMTFQCHSRSLQIALFNISHTTAFYNVGKGSLEVISTDMDRLAACDSLLT